MRKRYSSSFKSKVAIEAIKSDKTIAEISSSFERFTGIRYKSGRRQLWVEFRGYFQISRAVKKREIAKS